MPLHVLISLNSEQIIILIIDYIDWALYQVIIIIVVHIYMIWEGMESGKNIKLVYLSKMYTCFFMDVMITIAIKIKHLCFDLFDMLNKS